jgi:hypothetical protein
VEFVSHMEQKLRRGSSAALRDVQIKKSGGVCITHCATVKRCSFEGCKNGVVKAGVCITHGAKLQRPKVTHANDNNPEPPQNVVPTAVSSLQLSNFFDDKEELNSWIWRSSRMARNFGASN